MSGGGGPLGVVPRVAVAEAIGVFSRKYRDREEVGKEKLVSEIPKDDGSEATHSMNVNSVVVGSMAVSRGKEASWIWSMGERASFWMSGSWQNATSAGRQEMATNGCFKIDATGRNQKWKEDVVLDLSQFARLVTSEVSGWRGQWEAADRLVEAPGLDSVCGSCTTQRQARRLEKRRMAICLVPAGLLTIRGGQSS